MSGGAAVERPHELTARWRGWCLLGAVVVALACLVPPLSDTASRFEYGEALQFSLLAIVVPALVALGAPWRQLGQARAAEAKTLRLADRVADRRLRHRELPWSLAFIAADLGAVVAWHAPGAVAGVSEHGWLIPLEGVILLAFGLGLWLELVPSPPLVPRSGYLRRAVLAVFAMWTFWILAYVLGLSNHAFYRNFAHVPGGLSAAADQQVATAVLWFVAAATFVPVIFWNAMLWLRTDEDPDAELLALERAERRRGTPPLTGRPDEGTSIP
jgi:cytochrome c oxidase assembly factor CtaG